MTENSPYQVLGVSEDASFEEIQAARERRLKRMTPHSEEEQERVEQAYDMILMQRLKLRKEGKIAVPDRIRYAERALEAEPEVPPPANTYKVVLPEWAGRLLDTPSSTDIFLPGAIFAVLCLGVLASSGEQFTVILSLGLLNSFYFLYRKERRFFRSLLMGLGGLIGGWLISTGVLSMVAGQSLSALWAVGFTFVVMWLVTAFLR